MAPHGQDDLWAAIRSQRACRAFADGSVDDAVISRLLEAATYAPSAENRQPWVFIVVRDPTARQFIGELNRRAWESGGRTTEEGRLSPALLADVESGVRGGIAGAPAIIVVCGDARVSHRQTLASSVFPAVQNLLLAATDLGLGSALTTLSTTLGAELRCLLDLPADVHPLAVVPIGRPAHSLGPPRRQDFRTKSFRDRFGVPWDRDRAGVPRDQEER